MDRARAAHSAHAPTRHRTTRSPDAMGNSLSLKRSNCSFAKSTKSIPMFELDNLDPPVRSVSEILYESNTFVVPASNEDQCRVWLRTTKRAVLEKARNRHLVWDLNTEENSKHVLRDSVIQTFRSMRSAVKSGTIVLINYNIKKK
eukprot:162218_1